MSDPIILIFSIIGILQLALLVKIWIMTDDVAKIKKILSNEKTNIDIGVSLLMGDTESAVLSKKREFFTKIVEIEANFGSNPNNKSVEERYTERYNEVIKEYDNLKSHINFEDYNTLQKLNNAISI